MTTLTPKMKAFAEARSKGLSIKDASDQAGLSPHTGRKLNREPRVVEYMDQLAMEHAKNSSIDAQWVERQLCTIVERCLQQVKPQLNSKTGKPIVKNGKAQFTFNANAAIAALKEIGKLKTIQAFGAEQIDITTRQEKIIEELNSVLPDQPRRDTPSKELSPALPTDSDTKH